MKNSFIFSARRTFVDNKKWLWVPYLSSLSGKNLFWPNKGHETREEAINYLERNIQTIQKNHF